MRLVLPACIALIELGTVGCAHEPTPIANGSYYAYDSQPNISPDEPTAIWFDKHLLTVHDGNVELYTSPGYVLHGRALYSASDGGFRTYDGHVELVAGRTIVGLRQLTCDYCESFDYPLPAKRVREYVAIHHDDGSFEVDHVRYYADPLARPIWFPPPGDSGDRFEYLYAMKLNETTLDFIEEVFGSAEEFDLEYSGFAICYRLSNPSLIVTFESDRWFGGKGRTLLGFSVDSVADASLSCADADGALFLDDLEVGGVRLGMTEAEFRDLVGEPLEVTTEGSVRREFHSVRLKTPRDLSRYTRKQRGTLDGHVDRYLNIEGTFQAGRLSRFSVRRSEAF